MAIVSKVQILPLTKQLTNLAGNAWYNSIFWSFWYLFTNFFVVAGIKCWTEVMPNGSSLLHEFVLEFREVVASLKTEAAGTFLSYFESPIAPYAGGHYHVRNLSGVRLSSQTSQSSSHSGIVCFSCTKFSNQVQRISTRKWENLDKVWCNVVFFFCQEQTQLIIWRQKAFPWSIWVFEWSLEIYSQ